jgi:SAM-dependent methyltransferase
MSTKSYWDLFYKKHTQKSFEWLIDTSCLDQVTSSLTNYKLTSILDVGCGSSLFSSQLSKSNSNMNHLICVDFAYEPLHYLKSLNSSSNNNSHHIDFVQCNCKRLPFRNNLFDLVLDKGYLDSVLKRLNLVSTQLAMKDTMESLNTILEKLEINKCLIQITDEQPDLRISLLDQYKHDEFKISYYFKEINVDESAYFVYFINKTKI